MSDNLTEEEMRAALFGKSSVASGDPIELPQHKPSLSPAPKAAVAKHLSSRLRVTMHVTKTFEGEVDVFIHDANTLSTLTAEAEAKAAAKKKKYRYFDVISVTPVQV